MSEKEDNIPTEEIQEPKEKTLKHNVDDELLALEEEIFKEAKKEQITTVAGASENESGNKDAETSEVDKDKMEVEKKAVKRGRRPKKQDLIDRILEVYEKMGKPCPISDSQLKKTRNADLERMLAELMEEAMKEAVKKEIVIEGVKQNEVGKAEFGAMLMWRTQSMALEGLEMLTNKYSDKLKTDLVGVSDDVNQSKEELMELLKQIYIEHGGAISEYMSPVSVYCYTMLTIVVGRLGKNFHKQLKETSEE